MDSTPKKTKSKYKSKKVELDGYVFDSKVESEYYIHLKELKAAGQVIGYKVHPKYLLQEAYVNFENKKIRKIEYEADFEVEYADRVEVIDIKGKATTDAKLKRKMFMFKYREVKFYWIVKYNRQWIDYFENEKRKTKNKKEKVKEKEEKKAKAKEIITKEYVKRSKKIKEDC